MQYKCQGPCPCERNVSAIENSNANQSASAYVRVRVHVHVHVHVLLCSERVQSVDVVLSFDVMWRVVVKCKKLNDTRWNKYEQIKSHHTKWVNEVLNVSCSNVSM